MYSCPPHPKTNITSSWMHCLYKSFLFYPSWETTLRPFWGSWHSINTISNIDSSKKCHHFHKTVMMKDWPKHIIYLGLLALFTNNYIYSPWKTTSHLRLPWEVVFSDRFHSALMEIIVYRQVSNIRHTKYQHLKDSHTAFAESLEARC